jgi:hypothetical protein
MTMDLYGHLVDASLWQAAWLTGAGLRQSRLALHDRL